MKEKVKMIQSKFADTFGLYLDMEKHKGGVRSEDKSYKSDESLSSSLARSKQKVKDYASNNSFDWFVTLTFDPKKFDSSKRGVVTNLVSGFNRYLRVRGCRYLEVLEYHKDHKKIHVHALIGGDVPHYTNENKHLSVSWWSKSRGYGFSSMKRINQSPEDLGKVANYVTKYITKELISQYDGKRYFCSKGLSVSRVEKQDVVGRKDTNPVEMLSGEDGYEYVQWNYVKGSICLTRRYPLSLNGAEYLGMSGIKNEDVPGLIFDCYGEYLHFLSQGFHVKDCIGYSRHVSVPLDENGEPDFDNLDVDEYVYDSNRFYLTKVGVEYIKPRGVPDESEDGTLSDGSGDDGSNGSGEMGSSNDLPF